MPENGHHDKSSIDFVRAERDRLADAAARALERVQVEDWREAEYILSQVVELDGTIIPPKPRTRHVPEPGRYVPCPTCGTRLSSDQLNDDRETECPSCLNVWQWNGRGWVRRVRSREEVASDPRLAALSRQVDAADGSLAERRPDADA